MIDWEKLTHEYIDKVVAWAHKAEPGEYDLAKLTNDKETFCYLIEQLEAWETDIENGKIKKNGNT